MRGIDDGFLIGKGGLAGVIGDGIGNAAGQGAITRVREEDLFAGDGELVVAKFFVRQDFGQIHGE